METVDGGRKPKDSEQVYSDDACIEFKRMEQCGGSTKVQETKTSVQIQRYCNVMSGLKNSRTYCKSNLITHIVNRLHVHGVCLWVCDKENPVQRPQCPLQPFHTHPVPSNLTTPSVTATGMQGQLVRDVISMCPPFIPRHRRPAGSRADQTGPSGHGCTYLRRRAVGVHSCAECLSCQPCAY